LTGELDKEDQKIFHGRLRDADLTEYKNLNDFNRQSSSSTQEVLFQHDKIA